MRIDKKNLSSYMRVVVRSRFPQYRLMNPRRFSEFLTSLNMRINIDELEYFDSQGILRPVLRLHNPALNNPSAAAAWIFDNKLLRDEYLPEGLAEFPRSGDFKPWNTYIRGYQTTVELLYHPFQFLSVPYLKHDKIRLSLRQLDNVKSPNKFLQQLKKDFRRSLRISKRNYREVWTARMGLLMLLEDAYAPLVRGFISSGLFDEPDVFSQWRRWRREEYYPKVILRTSGFTIPEVKELYMHLAGSANRIDPMGKWYAFLQYVKRSRKDTLQGDGQCAIQYYDLARMVRQFYFNLTGQRLSEPDELGEPGWKDRVYARRARQRRFRYENPKVRKLILDEYLDERAPQIAIVFEGRTEEYVIKSIFRALHVSKEKDGLLLFNARGSNMDRKIDGYADSAKANGIAVYVIVDKDKQGLVTRLISRGVLKRGMYRIWKDDFEYDNFDMKRVIEVINRKSAKKGYRPISHSAVLQRLGANNTFMHVVEAVFMNVNGGTQLTRVISKVEIAKAIFTPRARQIRSEYLGSGWKPASPIEKVIYQVFKKLPPHIL